MLFLLSLVGEGGAGFPICKNNSHIRSSITLKHHVWLTRLASSLQRERPESVSEISLWFLMRLCRALAIRDRLLMD